MDIFEPNIITWTWGTKQLVVADVGADVLLGEDQDPLEIRVYPLDWQDAEWEGVTEAETRRVRTVDVIDTAALDRTVRHSVYLRFGDSTETPIVMLGQIQLNF